MKASEIMTQLGYKIVATIKIGDIRHMWYDKASDTIIVKFELSGRMAQRLFGPKADSIHELVEGYQEYRKMYHQMEEERFDEIFARLDTAAEEL